MSSPQVGASCVPQAPAAVLASNARRLLDQRVHDLYLRADAEFPLDAEGDADARRLLEALCDTDPTVVSLLAQIDKEDSCPA